jgi:glutathione reductase (NADPH)
VRRFIAAEMSKTGVNMHLGAERCSHQKADARPAGERSRRRRRFEVDTVLYATGRVANTNGMGLEAVGVAVNAPGAIQVNDQYQTSVPSIYALGDVTARMQLTPVALARPWWWWTSSSARAGKKPRNMSTSLCRRPCSPTPTSAPVGYSEADARAKFGKVTVFRADFKALKHTLSGSTERTLMKLLVEDATDRVVGLHMVGARRRRDRAGLCGGDEGRRDQGDV